MKSDKLVKEHIVVSATKGLNGKIYVTGKDKHHFHIFKEMIGDGQDPHCGIKGFITSTGRFVDRHEAFKIASDAGQLKPGTNYDNERLISDDLLF
jgi:hypothetical protein